MSGPSSKEITTEVNELNQYTRFDNWGLEYDLNGNTTRKGTQKRRYDYRGNVVIYEDLSTHAEYKYDVLNRRMEKIVNGKVTKYYHSGYQVIEERDEDDQVTKQYVYGDGIDEILQMKIYRGPYLGTYYYHTDANNSVTAVTDQEGNLIERVSYDIYGVPTFKEYITDPGNAVTRDYSIIGNEILWHSRRYDPESHTYYFRNRAYDPTMGRFLQTDPMGYRDSMNLYQGFNMNPLNFNDPFGLEAWKVKNQWNQYYINKYRDYIKDIANVYVDVGLERICEDFALSTIIDFAEMQKLPITIRNKKGLFSASSDMFNSKEGFEREVLMTTAVSDLFFNTHPIYADLKPGDFRLLQKAQAGDIMILKEGNRYNHTQVVTDIDIEHVSIHQGNIDYGLFNERDFFRFLLPIADPSSTWYVGEKIKKGRWFKISGNYQREGKPMQIFADQGGFFNFHDTQIRIWNFLDWNQEMKKNEPEGN